MECGQQNCIKVATERMCWPGHEPLPICPECKRKAEAIGDAMGFRLHFEPLPEPPQESPQ